MTSDIHWNNLSDNEFISRGASFPSKSSYARSFGLKRTNPAFSKRFAVLGLAELQERNKNSVKEDELRKAVESASSVAEVIENLGWSKDQNSRYRIVRQAAALFDIELPAYDAKQTNAKLVSKYRMSDEEFFSYPSNRTGTHLRVRLIQYGLRYACANTECVLHDLEEMIWAGKPITLQVDHVNGDNSDNRINNLRFLCANCHSQTDTFANRKVDAKSGVCVCGLITYRKLGEDLVTYPCQHKVS